MPVGFTVKLQLGLRRRALCVICWRLTVKTGIEEEEDVTSAHFESLTVDLKGNTNATVQLSVVNSQTGKVVILG